MSEKIPLKEIITAVDQNVRELWDLIDEDQRKAMKKEFFILNRFISSVKADRETQEHFVLTVNEYFNKNWSELQHHPKLMWKLLCLCSHDSGKTFYHEWIKLERKAQDGSKTMKLLQIIHPEYKLDDLWFLASMYTDNEMKQLAKDHGWDDKQIKEL